MVVVVEGEGGARMALQVPPHYSLGRGALRRPSNPEPLQKRDPFFHDPDSLHFT